MKQHRIFKSALMGFFLSVIVIACVAQTIRGPVISTPFSRSLLDDATAEAARTTLGISGSSNYVFDTGQFTVTGTNDIHLKDGLTVSNLIVKTAMTNDALTASMAMVSDANKKIISSATSLAELAHLVGVTSRVVDTNDFESTQFDIRAGFLGIKDTVLFTNSTHKGVTLFDVGTNTAPSIGFSANPDVGFYYKANGLTVVADGTAVFDMYATGIFPSANSTMRLGSSGFGWLEIYSDSFIAGLGTAALPSYTFDGDVNTGAWSPGADQIAWSTAGVQRWDMDASGHLIPFADVTYDIGTSSKAVKDIYVEQVFAEDGTQSNPSYSFASDPNTGMFSSAGDKIYWAAGGVVYMSLDSSHLEYTDTQPEILLNEYDAGSNEKHWLISANGGSLNIQTETDAGGTQLTALSIERTGNDVTGAWWPFASSGEGMIVGYDGSGTHDAMFQVFGISNGDRVLRTEVESGGGLGNIVEDTYMARVETTDATITTLHTVPITASRTYLIEAIVTARRTGGASGTADDGAVYRREGMITTKSGTVTIDTVATTLTQEDQAGWDCTLDVNGSNIRVRVTGAASNTIDWTCKVTAQAQGL